MDARAQTFAWHEIWDKKKREDCEVGETGEDERCPLSSEASRRISD